MVIKSFFLLIVLLSFPSMASDGVLTFFDTVLEFINEIWIFFTVTIPMKIEAFFGWLVKWLIFSKIQSMIWAVEFSNTIAIEVLDLLALDDLINTSISGLPSEIRNVAIDVGFFEALTIVFEAFLTRLVYSFIS